MSVPVVLRPLTEADVDHIMTWVNDPVIVGNIAAFSGQAFTREAELAYVRQMIDSKADRVFSVLAAADGRYLGQVGIHQIHARSKVGRLSAIIASKADMGKGLGSAAIGLLLDEAFSALGLHKVWLMVFRENERSRRTYARIGFVEEGTLREEYFHGEGWHDMIRMGILASEWPAA